MIFDDQGELPDVATHEWSRARRVPGADHAANEFDEVKWWPLDAATINRVPSGSASFIRASVRRLMDNGVMEKDEAEHLLSKTG